MDRLLEHGRRGKLGALWEIALAEVERRLSRYTDVQGQLSMPRLP
jgi:hypothetical protein